MRVGIFLTCGQYFHGRIISLRGEMFELFRQCGIFCSSFSDLWIRLRSKVNAISKITKTTKMGFRPWSLTSIKVKGNKWMSGESRVLIIQTRQVFKGENEEQNIPHCRSFSGVRSRSEPPTMGKQLVNFITCGCKSSSPFFVIYKVGREPTSYWW
jgi:hypothetical protein